MTNVESDSRSDTVSLQTNPMHRDLVFPHWGFVIRISSF
jgi:hypothetical protein